MRPRQVRTLVTAVPLSQPSDMLDSSRGVLIVCAEKVDILWNNLQRRGESGASSRDLFARLPQLPRGELRSSFGVCAAITWVSAESTHTPLLSYLTLWYSQTGTKSHVCVPSWLCARSSIVHLNYCPAAWHAFIFNEPERLREIKKDVLAARAGLAAAARRVIRLTWRRDPFKPPSASLRAYNWYPHPAGWAGCFCLYGSPLAYIQARTAATCTLEIKYLPQRVLLLKLFYFVCDSCGSLKTQKSTKLV